MLNKKSKVKDSVLIYILLIILLLVFFLSKDIIKDYFNTVIGKTKDNKNIMISENVTATYIKELEKDNNELKKLNELKENSSYNCINASVTYRDPIFWYDELTINKGIKHNIKNKSMVITSTGLVGTISDTLNNSSTVSLLTNTNKKNKITVGIELKDKTIYGLISGYNHIKNEIIVSDITSDIIYEKNLKVVTTNFTNTFKSGLLIGIVKEIKNNADGLSKSVTVIPNTDFNNIRYVCVIGT